MAVRGVLVDLGAFVSIVGEFHNTTFESMCRPAKEHSNTHEMHLGHFMEVSG
jgi:hypothetical protein